MKSLVLLAVASLSTVLTACETRVVARRPVYHRHAAVVVAPRPAAVVVAPRPYYHREVDVRYYNDTRGRYYFRGGRRVYVNARVY